MREEAARYIVYCTSAAVPIPSTPSAGEPRRRVLPSFDGGVWGGGCHDGRALIDNCAYLPCLRKGHVLNDAEIGIFSVVRIAHFRVQPLRSNGNY
jgi:hypothetical protein